MLTFAARPPGSPHERPAMGARSPSLTYVSSAPLILTGTPYLLSKRKNRPVQFSVWQPRPFICRTVSSVPHYIYCRASKDEKDLSDKVSNKSRNPWDPFRTWFKPKAHPEQNADHSKTNCEHTDESESSTPTTESSDTSNNSRSNPKVEDRFRWPWQSTDAPNSDTETDQIHHQREFQKEEASATQNQKIRKRVKHNDSKPGSLIDVDEPSSQKNDVAWQERLKRMVDGIIPNMQKHEKHFEDANSDIPDTDASHEVADDERLAGVSELYKPPSQPLNNQNEKKDKSWFKPPWARGSAEESKSSNSSTLMTSKKHSDLPAKVSNSDSKDLLRNPRKVKEDDFVSTKFNSKNSDQKGQFNPFWKRQNGGTGHAPKGSSSRAEDRKNKPESTSVSTKNVSEKTSKEKPEVSFPSKKSWFQWPGTRSGEKNKDSANPIKEASESQFPQKRTTVTRRSDNKEQESEKVNRRKELLSHSEGNGKDGKSEGEPKEKLTTSHGSRPPVSSNKKRPSTESYSIPQRDISSIRQIFGSETFFATDTIPAPGGLLFHGNLRGEPQPTIDKLEKKLEAKFGSKYTLCLAEGEDQGPVVVVVPSSYHQQSPAPRHRLMAIGLATMTISTCLSRGLAAIVLRPRIIQAHGLPPRSNILERLFYYPLSSSVTVAVAIGLFLLFAHVAQRIVASYYRTKLAMPFVLPSYQLGSFGSVVYLVSPAPNRAALFDIAIASTVAMVIPAMICLVIGLRMSTSFASVFPVPMSLVSNSLLMGYLTQQVPNGKILVDYQRSLIGLHPLAIIGANCLTIAALNLLPIRQLDGSRIIGSLFGRRAALRAWRISVIYLLLASSKNPYLIMFLFVVSFGPWQVDRPSRNELTEPDNVRTIIGYLFMLLMIALLLPFPKSPFFGTLQ